MTELVVGICVIRDIASKPSARPGVCYIAAQETISGPAFGHHSAKVVVCVVDGKPIVAVVPAPLAVCLDRLRELAGVARSEWPPPTIWALMRCLGSVR